MNKNINELQEWSEIDCDSLDLDELESKLESELEEQKEELEGLEFEREKIGTPDSIGETIKNVVWEQFMNQIGVKAGEDFIEENQGLNLDLSDDAHIQTTPNFEKGDLATHNTKIDYKERYDEWQGKFQKDENGKIITHPTRTGEQKPTLVPGARAPYDKDRPSGSVERGTDMDHTVSAAEIIGNSAANAHLTQKERVDFANSPANLNEMPKSHNRSKGDNPTPEWLDTPNSKGQTPREIFADPKSPDYLGPEQEQQYREKDKEARAELDKRIKEGEQRSIEAGKQSQKEEAFRMGGKALRAAIMSLLASLIKDIIRNLINWLRSSKRKLSTFLDSVKSAITSFFSDIKAKLLNAGESMGTSIATAIFGPVIGVIKKAWIFLKQGYKSIKDAIKFLKDPANANMPFSLKMMQVGKIIIVGLTAGGAIVLSEVIEKALMTFPVFAFEIPLIGSLANIIGMFLGALVSGLIGALALNLIDRLIAKKLKRINEEKQSDKRNEIINTQNILIEVKKEITNTAKVDTQTVIQKRHVEAAQSMKSSVKAIARNSKEINKPIEEDIDSIDSNLGDLFDNITKL